MNKDITVSSKIGQSWKISCIAWKRNRFLTRIKSKREWVVHRWMIIAKRLHQNRRAIDTGVFITRLINEGYWALFFCVINMDFYQIAKRSTSLILDASINIKCHHVTKPIPDSGKPRRTKNLYRVRKAGSPCSVQQSPKLQNMIGMIMGNKHIG